MLIDERVNQHVFINIYVDGCVPMTAGSHFESKKEALSIAWEQAPSNCYYLTTVKIPYPVNANNKASHHNIMEVGEC